MHRIAQKIMERHGHDELYLCQGLKCW